MADEPVEIDLTERILDVIAKDGMVPREKVTLDATLESLGLKSMDMMMILTGLEEAFDVYIPVDGPLAECKDMRSLVTQISETIRLEKHG